MQGSHVSGNIKKLPFSGKSGKSQGNCSAPQGDLENAKMPGNLFGWGRFQCCGTIFGTGFVIRISCNQIGMVEIS